MKVSVSYLKHQNTIENTIQKINQTSADFIHVDLMDGFFAGSEKNYDERLIDLLSLAKLPLDIHLMMKNPEKMIEHLAILNPDNITIHIEIENVSKYLSKIKGLGLKTGLAINPDTNRKNLFPYLKEIDIILVMSVNPGYGGQPFQENILETLKELKELKEKEGYSFEISVDGGITDKTIENVKPYVERVVSGSFICMQNDYEKQIEKLKNRT